MREGKDRVLMIECRWRNGDADLATHVRLVLK
jgi:hypothetical protein